jgi:Zn-dependent protease
VNEADLGAMIQVASTWVLPVLLAITLHEAAHGFAAWKLGDDTAYLLGRVTINPLKHIDPVGTVLLPAALFFFNAPFMFGYAKPVPVNFRRLRHFRRDTALVAVAGPGTNLVLAIISALLLQATVYAPPEIAHWAQLTLGNSILLNVVLAVFNMLPVLPLDGGRVLAGLLPPALARPYYRTERYGMLLLLGAIIVLPMIGRQIGMDLNILGWILGPASDYLLQLVATLTGLNS